GLELLTKHVDHKVPADERAAEMEKCLVNIRSPLIANLGRRKRFIPLWVRSTTHQYRPKRSEDSTPRRAIRDVIPRRRRARRFALASPLRVAQRPGRAICRRKEVG